MACLAGAAFLAACGGDGGGGSDATPAPAGTSARFAATKVTLEPSGANCAFGGSRIESGIDSNNNGQLDVSEVSGVQYACNGAAGSAGSAGTTSLVRIDTEAAGANCANGGTKITSGLDTNGNRVLDPGEVSSTSYVCGGANGANGANGSNGANGTNGTNGRNSLIAIFNEAAGANCTFAGKKVTSGLDANGNNVLDAGEVTSTDYLCNGAPAAALNWVNVTGTSQGMASNTGYLANSGSQVTLTLPASPTIGDTVSVTGVGFGGWKIAQNAGQYISARNVANDLPAGAAWHSNGPNADWGAIAASADGNKLAAVGWSAPIYTSTDGGANWTARDSARAWSAIASSSDGSKLVAAVSSGPLFTSSDGGLNWVSRDSARAWSGVASSADGTKLVAVESGGYIYTSTDSGATWSAREGPGAWTAVASSADGTKLVATSYGRIYTSTDSGQTWVARDSSRQWLTVASSADGTKLVAGVADFPSTTGRLYTSTDSGQTWTPRESNRYWESVASSADGDKLVATAWGERVYISTDAGASWTPRGANDFRAAVATSSDGSKLIAVGSTVQVQHSWAGRSGLGTAGFVSGSQFDSLTLQYVGAGHWMVIGSAMAGTLQMQ